MRREEPYQEGLERPPGAKIVLEGTPIQKGLAIGMAAPLYLPIPGTPVWMDPRLFVFDEEQRAAIEYKMPVEAVEVVAFCRDLREVPPVLAPNVKVMAWVVETGLELPLPSVPVVQVPRLPPLIPPDVLVVVDGYTGLVFIEPDEKAINRYQARLMRLTGLTRYFLEDFHLPAVSWDGHPVAVGAWVESGEELEQAVRLGADFVCLSQIATDSLAREPESRDRLLALLGGKPLWLMGTPESLAPEVLWRLGARCALTYLLAQPSDRSSRQWEAWWQAMQEVRARLRAKRAEIGELQAGLAIQWRQPRRRPPSDAESPEVHLLCWRMAAPLWSQLKQVAALMESQLYAMRRGKHRALVLPGSEPALLAKGLGMEPQAILLPPAQIPQGKTFLHLLGLDECREWLLEWLTHPEQKGLESRPSEWIEQRLPRT